MERPSFFIIGAPKCGTSSLYYWLSEHSKIFMSDIKEPHFFAEDLTSRRVKTLERYQSLFDDANDDHLAIGEASTGYLFYHKSIEKIETRYSKVNYIVMLRNPIEMAKSLHEQEVKCGNEHIMDFESAWRLSPERRTGGRVHFGCEDPERLDYMKRCRIGTQIKRLVQKVPKERILFIFLEDIRKNSKKEYEKCLNFLNVPTDNKLKFQVINESKGIKYPKLRRLIRSAGRIRDLIKRKMGIDNSLGVELMKMMNDKERGERRNEIVKESLEMEMYEYFEEEIEKVESVTGRKLLCKESYNI